MLSLSALGCWSLVSISPITIPFSPPFTLSTVSIPSTSSPVSVKYLATTLASKSMFMYSFSQLYEIFIYNILSNKSNKKNEVISDWVL